MGKGYSEVEIRDLIQNSIKKEKTATTDLAKRLNEILILLNDM